ncbi:MAG: PIG-L family deacetylase [Elusimicrobia bacterium]|nr:PIG-L family deacetylase [Elusimicrobiota bacterium]
MNVLSIGAHFDDVELGCGGTLAKHVERGDAVYAFVATVSGFTNANNQSVRANATARSEGEAAMKALGVRELICGDFKTFEVEFIEALNVKILKIIEEKKIDLVYTHWTGDVHHDHKAVANATLHAGRHVPRLLMYRSNWYHGTSDFRGNFYVDVTKHWDAKEAAIRCHASEMERTGKKWLSFFAKEAENAGQRIGVKYAEVFEVVKWLER